jgi:hypothetical protein
MAYNYPAASLGDKLLVSFDGRLFQQRLLTTFWFQISALTGTPTLGLVMDQLKAQMVTANKLVPKFLAVCPNSYSLENIWIQPIDPIRYVKSVYLVGTSGTNSGVANTANQSIAVLRRGVIASRKSISVLKIPAPNDAASILDGIFENAVTSAAGAFGLESIQQIGLTSATVNPVIRNGPLAIDVQLIQNYEVELTARVMGRRTVGRGK